MYSKSVLLVGGVIRCRDCAISWSVSKHVYQYNYGCGVYRDVHNMLGIFKVYMCDIMHILCLIQSMSSK